MTSTIEWNRKRDESVVQVASPVFVKFHGPDWTSFQYVVGVAS